MLIIFDCDGVLVDSEFLAAEVMSAHLLETLCLNISAAQCLLIFKGRSLESCVNLIETEYEKQVPEQFITELQMKTLNAFEERLHPVEGIEAVLTILQAQAIPTCIASSGNHQKLQYTLSKTGLLSYFQAHKQDRRIFSATEVKAGKPAPDLFLYAAQRMSVLPRNAWVIEDSLPGIEAGAAAKMNVLGYVPPGGDDRIREFGVPCFSHMSQLPALLGVS